MLHIQNTQTSSDRLISCIIVISTACAYSSIVYENSKLAGQLQVQSWWVTTSRRHDSGPGLVLWFPSRCSRPELTLKDLRCRAIAVLKGACNIQSYKLRYIRLGVGEVDDHEPLAAKAVHIGGIVLQPSKLRNLRSRITSINVDTERLLFRYRDVSEAAEKVSFQFGWRDNLVQRY